MSLDHPMPVCAQTSLLLLTVLLAFLPPMQPVLPITPSQRVCCAEVGSAQPCVCCGELFLPRTQPAPLSTQDLAQPRSSSSPSTRSLLEPLAGKEQRHILYCVPAWPCPGMAVWLFFLLGRALLSVAEKCHPNLTAHVPNTSSAAFSLVLLG